MIDERIAERRRGVREDARRSRLRRTVTVVVVALLVAGLVAVERSPLVGLEEVRVAGADRLTEAEVRDASELELGRSTLRLRLGRVERRVERLPLVRAADARRLDPLTVLIEVVEREPALVVEGGGATRLVDREGVVMQDEELEGLPRVSLDEEPPAPGETVGEVAALRNAFAAWRALSGPLRTEVVHYEAGGPDDLSLRLASGVQVRFGRAERVDEKVRALGVILEDAGDEEVSEIDVRAPSAPVVVR